MNNSILRMAVQAFSYLVLFLISLTFHRIFSLEPVGTFLEFESFLSFYLWGAINDLSPLNAIFALVLAFLSGRYTRLPVLIIGLLPPCFLAAMAMLEMQIVPGSHNILGIEVGFNLLFIGLPLLLSATFGRIWLKKSTRPKSSQAYAPCAHCLYDLTGNVSGTCPECGNKIVGKRQGLVVANQESVSFEGPVH